MQLKQQTAKELNNLLRQKYQGDPHHKQKRAMRDISKHHSEQKRKRRNSKKSWVYFFVARNSVSVNNFLKGGGELV